MDWFSSSIIIYLNARIGYGTKAFLFFIGIERKYDKGN
jgi:hypothetical protein